MLGGFSDKVSLLLNYTLGGVCIPVTTSFVVVVPVGVFLMYSEAVLLCDGKLDVSLPCQDDEPFSYMLI